jgi:hypothetical protein
MPVLSTSAYNTVSSVIPLIQSLLNDPQGNVFTVPGLAQPIVGAPLGATNVVGVTVIITTVNPHGLNPGQQTVIAGVGVAGYNGTYTVLTTPTPYTFTYNIGAGGLGASGGGTSTFQGGTILPAQVNLMPYLNSCYRTIRRKLTVIGDETFVYDNIVITVAPIALADPSVQVTVNDATPPPNNLPFNLIEPDKLWERLTGSTDQFVEMVDMTGHGGLPSRPQDTTRLSLWEWRTDALVFLGCLSSVDVRMRYKAGLPDLIGGGDTILTRDVLDTLALLTAAEAAGSKGSPLGERYLTEGTDALEDMVQMVVHRDQVTGRRRRSYSHRKGLNR